MHSGQKLAWLESPQRWSLCQTNHFQRAGIIRWNSLRLNQIPQAAQSLSAARRWLMARYYFLTILILNLFSVSFILCGRLGLFHNIHFDQNPAVKGFCQSSFFLCRSSYLCILLKSWCFVIRISTITKIYCSIIKRHFELFILTVAFL